MGPRLQRLVDERKISIAVASALGQLPRAIQSAVWDAARQHSREAKGQEAYVRSVVLRQAGTDLFGQEIVEFVSGLSPAQ